MTVGKKYRCASGRFPFGEEVGIYQGETPGGFLHFTHESGRESLMNGGYYEELPDTEIIGHCVIPNCGKQIRQGEGHYAFLTGIQCQGCGDRNWQNETRGLQL